MQARKLINRASLEQVLSTCFEKGGPKVFEAYSEYGAKRLKEFLSQKEMENEIKRLLDRGEPSFQFALYYPEAGGYVDIEKVKLDPIACNGFKHRYSARGWGLIYLQFRQKWPKKKMKSDEIECSILVNTEKRATNWKDHCPSLKDPNLWDWKLVETHAKRIIRIVRKIGYEITYK